MSREATAFTPTPPRERNGDLVFAALLIALGALFLLGNLGVIRPLSLRAVLSLWPLVPILIGIQLLVARTRPSLALGLQASLLAIGIALVVARAYVAPFH